MTKYLLPSWKKALDSKIHDECEKHKHEKNPEDHYRNVWYHVWNFVADEIKNGGMIEEFKPFAEEYCKNHVRAKLKSYLLFRHV